MHATTEELLCSHGNLTLSKFEISKMLHKGQCRISLQSYNMIQAIYEELPCPQGTECHPLPAPILLASPGNDNTPRA